MQTFVKLTVAVHHKRDRVADLAAAQLVGGDAEREKVAAGRAREAGVRRRRKTSPPASAPSRMRRRRARAIERRAGATSVARSCGSLTSPSPSIRAATRARSVSSTKTPVAWRTAVIDGEALAEDEARGLVARRSSASPGQGSR